MLGSKILLESLKSWITIIVIQLASQAFLLPCGPRAGHFSFRCKTNWKNPCRENQEELDPSRACESYPNAVHTWLSVVRRLVFGHWIEMIALQNSDEIDSRKPTVGKGSDSCCILVVLLL